MGGEKQRGSRNSKIWMKLVCEKCLGRRDSSTDGVNIILRTHSFEIKAFLQQVNQK